MLKTELASWLSRSRELFPLGAENVEVWAAFTTRLAKVEYDRALRALEDYAIERSGTGRKFIPGIFQEYFAKLPDVEDTQRMYLESAQRLERESVRQLTYSRISDERDMMRDTVANAKASDVAAIVEELVLWGAPRPAGDRSVWPWPYTMAVYDILTDTMRAAPTENRYYEQVRDDRGQWVDDPTRPFRLLTARAWWQTYGVAGLVARGLAPVG
jgi:hypothetical protein